MPFHNRQLGSNCKWSDVVYPLMRWGLSNLTVQKRLTKHELSCGIEFEGFDWNDTCNDQTIAIFDWVKGAHKPYQDVEFTNPIFVVLDAVFYCMGYPLK